jgi:sugar phosphate isomerase/epimerase
MKIGVQIASFGLPFKQAVAAASKLGVDSVEIDARRDLRPSELSGTGLRQIRKLLNDHNLRVVAVRFQTRRGYDTAEDLDRRIEATRDAIRMAGDLGAGVLVNQIGFIGEKDDEPGIELLRTVMSDFGQWSHRHGVFIGCETGSESLSRLVGFVESLPEGSTGITLNPGNLIVNGFEFDNLSVAAKHIMLVHAKDAVRDRARGRGAEVPLGRGLAEFPLIAAALDERHFQGAFIIDREPSRNIGEELARSIAFLRSL